MVTTGPFEQQLKRVAESYALPDSQYIFVPNPKYDSTNYLYSIWLAREYLQDEVLLLHGDLVFDRGYTRELMDSPYANAGSVNAALPLPQKDFKARVAGGRVVEVSTTIFGEDCVAFQPFYKLSSDVMDAWVKKMGDYVERGEVGVYAEDAGNEIFPSCDIVAFSYAGHLVEEIDTREDYERVGELVREYDARQQAIVTGADFFETQDSWKSYVVGGLRPLLVCGRGFDSLSLASTLKECFKSAVRFSDFSSNPLLQEVHDGCAVFRDRGCDSIVAVGGGSAIDVAKAIKYHICSEKGDSQGLMPPFDAPLSLVAIPTTAGTGSESTNFAVCYDRGEKLSIESALLLPTVAVLEPDLLKSVPLYHRSATFFDALSQAMESYWSINSTIESRDYARRALSILRCSFSSYFGESPCSEDYSQVQIAANYAGRAINISKTTAPHAMSYVLTGEFGIAHGHAVSLCLPVVWRAMLEAPPDRCVDSRGYAYVMAVFDEIANALGFDEPREAIAWYVEAVESVGLHKPAEMTEDDAAKYAALVNLERLRNSPVGFGEFDLQNLYRTIADNAWGSF